MDKNRDQLTFMQPNIYKLMMSLKTP